MPETTLKFNRNYYLLVEKNLPSVTDDPSRGGVIGALAALGGAAPVNYLSIQPPFTLEFDINRHSLGSVNYATIKIYNLSKQSREAIAKNWNDFNNYKQVIFQAGYGDVIANLPILFLGNVSQVQSARVGNNYITTIEAFDGGLAYSNGNISLSFDSGITNQQAVNQIVSSLKQYGILPGSIGTISGTTARGKSYTGSPISILQEITNSKVFIESGRINILGSNEVVEVPVIPVINNASGLLGPPVREQSYLNFDTLFEPSLVVGQQIYLQSNEISSNYTTYYNIVQLQHKGMISPAVCGDAVTSIGVFAQAQSFIPVQYAVNHA